MLLLTDRLNESSRLIEFLKDIEYCHIVALHQALEKSPAISIIICDVALDNITSLDLAREAVAHHRGASKTPVLCLTRDPSHLTRSQAGAIGATAIIPCHASPAELVATVKRLIAGGSPTNNGGQDHSIETQTSVYEAHSSLSELLEAAKQRKPVSLASVERGGDAVLLAVRQARIQAWLDIVWAYDDQTYQHCLLVAGLTAAFAIKLGLSLPGQRLLSQAALLHDIGKAYIPNKILNKPGALSPAEWNIMKTHAALGHNILMRQPEFDVRLLDVVHHHHEYLDGTGYPEGLTEKQIPQFVRLVTICDVYAALIERRSYKEPFSPSKALSILFDMKHKLDRSLLEEFHTVVTGV